MISVVVTVAERPTRLADLYHAHAAVLRQSEPEFEFIFVLQPWHGDLAAPLLALREGGEPIRVLEVAQGVGEAELLRLGVERARGDMVVSMPGYWRVEAASLPRLIDGVAAGADMVVARRWPRRDSGVNKLQNRLFHGLVRSVSGSEFRDLACGVRAFRKEVIEEVPLYGDFHRFLPLLAERRGFRVEELDAPQHPDDVGRRLHSPGVYLRRILDILGMFFLLRFTHKPLRFFGLVGAALSAAGGIVLLVLLIQRLGGQGIADRPLLLAGVLFLALGVQAIALGLIGEIIVFLQAPENPPYRIAREAGQAQPGDADRPTRPASAPTTRVPAEP